MPATMWAEPLVEPVGMCSPATSDRPVAGGAGVAGPHTWAAGCVLLALGRVVAGV